MRLAKQFLVCTLERGSGRPENIHLPRRRAYHPPQGIRDFGIRLFVDPHTL
jgi:hypothetical protein